MSILRQLALSTSLLGAVSVSVAPTAIQAQGTEVETLPSFSAMVSEKLPAVVGILATSEAPRRQMAPGPQLPPGMEEFFGSPAPRAPQRGPMRAQGSGFILSTDGYVVTNNHVIESAQEIEVVLEDDRRFDAELVGTDPATDIALLKIESDEAFPNVVWGASQDLEIGDWVVAIGNPFGLGGTVTAGIVSARSRNINSGPYDDFLQTDAAINRGNSGGPLFDTDGDVVGVNTAIFSPTGGSVGIGFAVPSRVAASIVEDLRDDGEVERGWLGVQIQPVTEALASALDLETEGGALIADVTADSPAQEAGLEAGDVITRIQDTDIEDPRDLSFAVAELDVGSEATLVVIRDGTEEEIELTIGQQPTPDAMAEGDPAQDDTESTPDGPRIGVALSQLTDEIRNQFQIPEAVNGLVVTNVSPEGPAAEAGLREGDVIVSADGEETGEIDALRSAITAASDADEPVLLRLYRSGSYNFAAVEPELPTDEG